MEPGAHLGWFAALAAGILSFASPCIFPLVPGYLSFVSGISLEQLQAEPRRHLGRVLGASVLFCLGFSLVFILFGASASLVSLWLGQNKRLLARISGALIILLGLLLTGWVKPTRLQRACRLPPLRREASLWSAPLVGIAFGFGWTPCAGPVLGAILGLAAFSGSVGQGIALLALYSAGLALPFLASALFTGYLLGRMAWLGRRLRAVSAVAGLFLVVMGLLLVTGQWARVVAWLAPHLPAAG